MSIHIDLVEAAWIATNVLAVLLTIVALVDARRDRNALRRRNGRARHLVARGNVRREAIRLVVQLLLLSLVLPGVFLDRQTPLNPFVVALIAIALLLLASSIADQRERTRLSAIIDAEILEERLHGAIAAQ